MLVILSFEVGALLCFPLRPFSVSLLITVLLSGYCLGASLIQWKQNKAEMATLYISPFCLDLPPQPTWASILAATFPLKCRMEELGSLLAAGSMNPSGLNIGF